MIKLKPLIDYKYYNIGDVMKKDIRELSLEYLYKEYKEIIDSIKTKDDAIKVGFKIAEDFDNVTVSRGASDHLARLVSWPLKGRAVGYLDFYTQIHEDSN